MTKRKRAPRSGPISAADWVTASRKRLIEEGISAVKVEPLARDLEVTPGSFYWHFKNRKSLHRALLRDWLHCNVRPFSVIFDSAEDEPREQFLALISFWICSEDFDPALDVAIREWGKTSQLVARLVRRVDANRIALFQYVFEGFGYASKPALVRARTMYFHQIGYFTLKVEEELDDRLMLAPYYTEVLTGDPWLMDYKTPEEVRCALLGFRRREGTAEKVARLRR